VALAEAAGSEPPLSAAEQQHLARQWVLGVAGIAEPISSQYKGQQVMAFIQELVQKELREQV
jgi:hypothetical protein